MILSCTVAAGLLLGRPPSGLVGTPAESVLGPLPGASAPFSLSSATWRAQGFPGPEGTGWIVLEPVAPASGLRDRFPLFFETLACGVAILDDAFRLVEANREWARILGYERTELVGRLLSEFIVVEEREAHAKRRDVIRSDPARDGVQRRRVLHRSGRVVLVEGTATPFVQDGSPLYLAVIFDVTAIMEAEEARRASDERFRLAFENAPVGMGLFEPDGRVRAMNRAFADMLGETAEDLVGRALVDLVSTEDVPVVEARLRHHESGADPLPNIRFRARHRAGHQVPAEGGSAPIRDVTDRVTGYVGHAVDLTDHLRLEEQVRRSQRSETVGRIAGGVAHDFNNLLGIIRGSVGLLQAEGGAPPRSAELLGRIDVAATRAADLTRQLTILGRRDFTTSGDSNPREVLRDIHAILAGALGEGIVLGVSVSADVAEVRMARPHLEQLLLNLTMNAREAMPDGGEFRIDVCRVDLGGDDLAAGRLQGEFVRLRIADTGAGMPPEVAAVAFEPFFTTKSRGKGSGLGLAIVQSLVAQAGGYVDLATRPGGGATFTLYLPARSPLALSSPPDRAPAPAGRGETLILCEDEPALLAVLTDVLQRAGYRVLAAADPEEAVRHSNAGMRIDALITDVVMPGMGGIVLAAEIRRRHPNAPVLFVSGYSEEHLGSAADPAFGAFLAKPFLPRDLVQAVRLLLG